MAMYNPCVNKRSSRPITEVKVQGGKKKHGSHRSTIIGKYQFKTKPVTELNQTGIIWQ